MSDKENMEIHLGRIEKRLEGLKCPNCGKVNDGGTSLDDQQAAKMPKPGDFGICVFCCSLNVYTETLGLRRIERTERRRMQRDPRLAELIRLALDYVQQRRRGLQ